MSENVISTKIIFTSIVALVILISLTVLSIILYPQYAYETYEINLDDTDINSSSDRSSRGKSVISIISEPNNYGFDCDIKKGHDYPFCLSQINFTDLINQGVDLSRFYKMRVFGSYTSPQKTDFLRITLMNYHPDYSISGKLSTYKYNLIELQSQTLNFPIEINLNNLKVPLWWASNMRKENVTTQTDITNITTIELSTGTEASLGQHELRVSKVEFEAMRITTNQLYLYILMIWGTLLLMFAAIAMFFLLKNLKQTKRNELNLIAINELLSVKSAELELISQQDELTGLLNRTGLKTKMLECLDKKQYPLTVVMVDLDYFKNINDTYGHQKGDLVLSDVGTMLKEFIRDDESVSRFGGEEFIILMPEKSVDDVLERLDCLRKQIEMKDMHIDQNVTASFGLASSYEYSGIKHLIELADSALYKAKQEGRNCIRVNN